MKWDASSVTWASFVGVHGLNHDEYSVPLVAAAPGKPAGWHEVDVLASVRRWQAAAPLASSTLLHSPPPSPPPHLHRRLSGVSTTHRPEYCDCVRRDRRTPH